VLNKVQRHLRIKLEEDVQESPVVKWLEINDGKYFIDLKTLDDVDIEHCFQRRDVDALDKHLPAYQKGKVSLSS
jgi:hypothetical protein